MVGKGKGEVYRHGRFTYSAFSTQHKDNVFYIDLCFRWQSFGGALVMCGRAGSTVFCAGCVITSTFWCFLICCHADIGSPYLWVGTIFPRIDQLSVFYRPVQEDCSQVPIFILTVSGTVAGIRPESMSCEITINVFVPARGDIPGPAPVFLHRLLNTS